LVGAAIGALLSRPPSDPYTADAAIAIRPNVPGGPDEVALQRARWKLAAESLSLPQVLTQIANFSPLSSSNAALRRRLSVRGAPQTGLLVVRARGENPAAAVALATAASQSLVAFLRLTRESGGVDPRGINFDFEDGRQSWNTARSLFLATPSSSRQAAGAARFGRGFLSVGCPTPRDGCGASVKIDGAFLPARVYRADAWVRSPARGRPPLRMVLGGSPADVATGVTARVGNGWARINVRWTPRRFFTIAELGVQVNGAGPAAFDADAVTLTGPGLDPTFTEGRRATRLARGDRPDRFAVLDTARPSGKVPSPTITAALLGAGIGFVTVVGGLAAWWLARRRQQSEQDPDL
jgi:hypothetical protein